MPARSSLTPANAYFTAIADIVKHEIRPQYAVSFQHEVDLRGVEALRARAETRASYTTYVVKAVALALRDHPAANRRLYARWWMPFFRVGMQTFAHADVAVASERSIPDAECLAFFDVLRDADRAPLGEIHGWLADLATSDESTNAQWKAFHALIGRRPWFLAKYLIRLPFYFPSLWERYRGAAVLVSSPGKHGVDAILGTWSHPLGVSFGFVRERAVVLDGVVRPVPTFLLSLSFDRRLLAGGPAAKFFARIVWHLEHAEESMAPRLPDKLPDSNAATTCRPVAACAR